MAMLPPGAFRMPTSNRVFECHLCGYLTGDYEFYTEAFEENSTVRVREGMHLFLLCPLCIENTKKKIEKIRTCSLNLIPLLINIQNPFIAYAVRERLKQAQVFGTGRQAGFKIQ